MNNLKFREYYDKVKGCYLGKNIGGTLGAPFECYRGVYDIDGFMQDVSSPIPNDDVDLQLVWLAAVEQEGRRIDSHVLAEYWDYYVTAVISEYGTGKNNFNKGIMPPHTGYLRNFNRDSNGAWIRTEIWACLCAGNPMLAATYAYYDSGDPDPPGRVPEGRDPVARRQWGGGPQAGGSLCGLAQAPPVLAGIVAARKPL